MTGIPHSISRRDPKAIGRGRAKSSSVTSGFRLLLGLGAMFLCSQQAAGQISGPSIVSALPGVSKISAANAAGVLKYCQQMDLVSGVSADAVVDQWADKPDVGSADYLAGASGQILGDAGKNFSISKAPGYLQSQACNRVLEQAKTLRPAP